MANPASSATRQLESSSAAAAAASPSAVQRPTVDLTALTTRDDFLLELGQALGGQASVNPVDSAEAAIGQLASTKRGQLLVIDARCTSDVRGDVQRAAQQAPHAVVVVFAEADAEKPTAAAVKGTSVFAVLTVPIELTKAAAVLDAAVADAVSRSAAGPGRGERPAEASSTATATLNAFRPPMSYSQAPQSSEVEPTEGGRKGALWAGLGLAVVAIAVGAGWYFIHGKTTTSLSTVRSGHAAAQAVAAAPAALPQPAVDTSIVAGRVDDLLEKARLAMRDRRFTAPTGNNALVYYRSALAADPTSGEAKDGLRRVGDVVISRFNDAMSGGHLNDAALALATLKLVQPSDSHLQSFQLQLSTAEISKVLTDGNADRAAALLRQAQQSHAVSAAQLASWRTQLTHLQQTDKVQSLAALVMSRIRADELTSPATDSAQAYLDQLRAAAPGASATQHAANALIAAFFDKARQDAESGNSQEASRWLADARASGASAAAVAAFQRQLASAQAKAARTRLESLATLVRERLASGALSAPAGDSAADYLRQLEADHPTGSALTSAVKAKAELAAKLIHRARTEMRSGNDVSARTDLADATSWGASAAAVAAVKRIGAKPATTQQPAAGPDMAALARQLKRTRYIAPQYPERALEQRLSGTVTVQYVVDKRGHTRDVEVTESKPAGIFDRAAVEAIEGWRYRPVKYDGKPIEVPVRARIRFELPN